MSNNELNCLVVGSSFISDLQIKRLLLIFDRIYFLDPSENDYFIPPNVAIVKYPDMELHLMGYLPLYDGFRIKEHEEKALNQLEDAKASDFFRVISPKSTGFYKKYWLPLRLAYDFDTGDQELLDTLRPLVRFDGNATVSSGIIRGAIIQRVGANFYPHIPPVPKCFDEEIDKRYKCEIQLLSAVARVNRALAISGVHNLVPVFLEKELQDFFLLKGQKIVQRADSALKASFCRVKGTPEMKLQRVLSEISSTFITDSELSVITLPELVLARKNTFHDLVKLKRKLNNEINKLLQQEYTEEFEKEVTEYIEREIIPQANLYSNSLVQKIRDFLHLSGSFAPAALATYIGGHYQCSPIELSLLAGVSAVVGNYSTNLVDYLVAPRRDKTYNSFSYFLKIKE